MDNKFSSRMGRTISKATAPDSPCGHVQYKSLHVWVLRCDNKCGRKLRSWKAGKNLSAVLAKANISEWRLLDYYVSGAWVPLLWVRERPELKWKPVQTSWRAEHSVLTTMGREICCGEVITALGVASAKIQNTCPFKYAHSFWVL